MIPSATTTHRDGGEPAERNHGGRKVLVVTMRDCRRRGALKSTEPVNMGRGHNSHRQLLKRRWFKRLFYQVTRGFLLRPLSRRYFDMHIVGRERIPDEPCVIAIG